MRRHPGRRIDEVLPCRGLLWEKFLRPVLVSALNTAPEEGIGRSCRRGHARDLRQGRPPHPSARRHAEPGRGLRRSGAAALAPVAARRSGSAAGCVALKLRRRQGGRLDLRRRRGDAGAAGRVILAVPPWTAQELLPDLTAPDAFRAIVNAHFKIVPPAGAPLLVGLIGGTAEWVFAFPDRLSVTVSAADRLVDMDTQELAALLWRDVAAVHNLAGPIPPCRIVKEKRATFAATPAQDARRPPVPHALDQPVPRRRLDRLPACRRPSRARCAPGKRRRLSLATERRSRDDLAIGDRRPAFEPRRAGAAAPAARATGTGSSSSRPTPRSRPNTSCCASISASRTIWNWSARSASICAASRASMAAGRCSMAAPSTSARR